MHFTGIINVRFKNSVLEPQGQAVLLSLKESGFTGIETIRVGKHIEVSIEANNKEEADQKLRDITEKLLYNPVMETAEILLEEKS